MIRWLKALYAKWVKSAYEPDPEPRVLRGRLPSASSRTTPARQPKVVGTAHIRVSRRKHGGI